MTWSANEFGTGWPVWIAIGIDRDDDGVMKLSDGTATLFLDVQLSVSERVGFIHQAAHEGWPLDLTIY